MKAAIIKAVIQIVLWAAALGIGVWYLYQSIPGASMSMQYTSVPRFLESIGACKDGVCDIASANGCFLCPYVHSLFMIIGRATETLWGAIINHTWILLVIGLVVFMIWQAYQVIKKANEENAKLDTGKRELGFMEWFNAVKGQLIRVLIVGALLGAAGFGGTRIMRATSETIIYPVMSIGTSLSMAATGMAGNATCEMNAVNNENPMDRVSNSFVCVIGNLNSVVLLGANSGFAMMNFAWMDMGGGVLTWIAGLAIVLLFLYIGFNVMFKVMNVVFNLVFVIVFLPLLIAAFAFDKWKIADGVSTGAVDMLAKTAVKVVGITIEVMIVSALVNYSFKSTMSSDPIAEQRIVEKCERMAANDKGEIVKESYKSCFVAERAANPDAFRYLDKGWDFLIMMLFIFTIYFALVDKKLQKIINTSDEGDDVYFKFGTNLKAFGTTVWNSVNQWLKKIPMPGKK